MKVLKSFSFSGKVALVTGAARGLGQALAVGLAEAGADLYLLDRDRCEETLGKIAQQERNCRSSVVDLAGLDPARAKEIIDRCHTSLGGFHILVNNAGIIRRSPALDFQPPDWQEVLDINLNSIFYLAQAAARYFSQSSKSGKIINVASMLSFQGGWRVPSYTASKTAVVGLTKALANEWAPLGINVNAIAPGYFKTEVTAGIRADPVRSQVVLGRIPAGRWGDPQDLKGAVVFLASHASDYMHGTVITVDGGWLAR